MKKTTNDNLKNKYLLIGLSIFCVLLIVVSFLDGSAAAPVKQVSGFVITPIQKGINGFGVWLSGLTDNFEDAETLRAENAELQERVDTLTEENSQLIQDREELQRLRTLFDLDEQYSDYEKVGARVIAKESGQLVSAVYDRQGFQRRHRTGHECHIGRRSGRHRDGNRAELVDRPLDH